jgi:hypothetical protein
MAADTKEPSPWALERARDLLDRVEVIASVIRETEEVARALDAARAEGASMAERRAQEAESALLQAFDSAAQLVAARERIAALEGAIRDLLPVPTLS